MKGVRKVTYPKRMDDDGGGDDVEQLSWNRRDGQCGAMASNRAILACRSPEVK